MRTRSAEFSKRIHPQNNTKGFTALMYATLIDDLETVRTLLEVWFARFEKWEGLLMPSRPCSRLRGEGAQEGTPA